MTRYHGQAPRWLRDAIEEYWHQQTAKGGSAARDARRAARSPQLMLTWYVYELHSGKKQAAEVWRRHQERDLERAGLPVVHDGLEDWPSWLVNSWPGRGSRHVPPQDPIYGWRAWLLNRGRLVAPFMTSANELGPDFTEGAWLLGINSVRSDGATCNSTNANLRASYHPSEPCLCGIRAMRSTAALRIYLRSSATVSGYAHRTLAIGRVALWGWAAGPAHNFGDHMHTVRAQKAQLVGPLLLSGHQPAPSTVARLAAEHDVEVLPDPDGPVTPDQGREQLADWIYCALGHRHWGPRGAAGLLLRHRDERGRARFLLQHRSPHTHHGGTWGIPGGAAHIGETAEQAARRESTEEHGPLPPLTVLGTIDDNHGGWTYTTVVATTSRRFTPSRLSAEVGPLGTAWLTLDEALARSLHPGLEAVLIRADRGDLD